MWIHRIFSIVSLLSHNLCDSQKHCQHCGWLSWRSSSCFHRRLSRLKEDTKLNKQREIWNISSSLFLILLIILLIHFDSLWDFGEQVETKSPLKSFRRLSFSRAYELLLTLIFFWCLEPHGSLMEASMISSFRFKSTRSFGVCGQPDCGRWSERRPTEQCHRMQCVHQERIRGTEYMAQRAQWASHEYRKKCSMKTQWRLNEELIIHKDFSNELHSMKTHSERRWCRTECVLICTNLYYRSGGESSVWPSADDERITM